jgi:hypothetical protein
VFEAIIALLIVLVLLLSVGLPAAWLLWAGAALGTLGALVGIPAGVVYHARLWRALRRDGKPTDGFWLNPMRLHASVQALELPLIQRWFALGVFGFAATMLGGLAVAIALIRLLT